MWLALIALGCGTWTAPAVWRVAVDLSLYSHLPNCSGGIERPVNVPDVRLNQFPNWVRIALGLIALPWWWESILFSWASWRQAVHFSDACGESRRGFSTSPRFTNRHVYCAADWSAVFWRRRDEQIRLHLFTFSHTHLLYKYKSL